MAQQNPSLKSHSKITKAVKVLAEKAGTSDLHTILMEEISSLDMLVEVREMPMEVSEDTTQNIEKSPTSRQKWMSLVKHGFRNITRQLRVETSMTLEKLATTSKRTIVESTPMSMRTLVAPLAFNFKSKMPVEKSVVCEGVGKYTSGEP